MPFILLLISCLRFFSAGPPAPVRASVYIFLADTCPISQQATLTMRALYFRYSSQGIGFGGVFPSATTTDADIAAFAKAYRMPFVLTHDADHRLTRRLKVRVTPEVVVLAADAHTVLYQGRLDDTFARLGQRRTVVQHHELADALAAVVAGRPVAVPRTEPVGCFIE
jgi:AhpC/TSA family